MLVHTRTFVNNLQPSFNCAILSCGPQSTQASHFSVIGWQTWLLDRLITSIYGYVTCNIQCGQSARENGGLGVGHDEALDLYSTTFPCRSAITHYHAHQALDNQYS